MTTSGKGGATGAIDPVMFEIVRKALAAICAEMALVVVKSAYSPAVNEGRDFAGTMYDRDGNLVAQSEFDLPAFVGLSMFTVKEVIRQVGLENMDPGDIFMINDPYVSTTHCNDVHFIKPIYSEGERIAFVSSTAHWTDVGGPVPGSLNSRATSRFEEGMRVPAVKIIKQGELQRDMWSMFLANVREPWERIGDLNAQVSSLRTGDARLNALIGKYGRGVVEAGMAEMQNHSERLVRAALRVLPDGVYQAVDQNDEDFTTGLPVTIRVTLTIEGDHAIFDLSESDDAAKSSINASIVSTTSSMFTALGAILPPMPMSAGIMRAVEVRARPGSVVYAQMPSPVSTQASTMEVTMSVGMVALSQALPERGAGSCSTILNTLYGGFDDRPGFESSFLEYLWGVGGMGGTKYRDGPNVVGSAYTATLQNIPVELQERRYPLLWLRFMVKPDSGGPGRSRGGLALDQYCAFPFLEEGTLTNFGGRNRFGPPGIFGGRPGGTSGLVLNEGTERQRNEGFLSVNIPVRRRETLSLWSAGGGGYGDPLERPPARVIEDIQDEYVTIAGARAQYGVVVQEIDRRRLLYDVDQQATERLRAEMRAARATRA